jgi:hypothetical protein
VAPLASRLLANTHPVVRAELSRQNTQPQASPRTGAGSPKWKACHQAYRHAHGVQRVMPSLVQLRSPRERDMWAILHALHSRSCANLVADLSQSLARSPIRTDGTLPTVTPGGQICIQSLGRCVLPVEKLLCHAFPLHTLNLEDLSPTELASLGGNTMHVQCVGAAIAMAVALTKGHLSIGRPYALCSVPRGPPRPRHACSQRRLGRSRGTPPTSGPGDALSGHSGQTIRWAGAGVAARKGVAGVAARNSVAGVAARKGVAGVAARKGVAPQSRPGAQEPSSKGHKRRRMGTEPAALRQTLSDLFGDGSA